MKKSPEFVQPSMPNTGLEMLDKCLSPIRAIIFQMIAFSQSKFLRIKVCCTIGSACGGVDRAVASAVRIQSSAILFAINFIERTK